MKVQEILEIQEMKALEVIEKLVNLKEFFKEVTTYVTSIFLIMGVYYTLFLTFH